MSLKSGKVDPQGHCEGAEGDCGNLNSFTETTVSILLLYNGLRKHGNKNAQKKQGVERLYYREKICLG